MLALGLAACGSSSSSSSSSGQHDELEASKLRDDLRSRFERSLHPCTNKWASAQSGLTVNYQAVGFGAPGITSLEAKTVDFGASDPPLKPEDEEAIAKNGSPAVEIPMFLARSPVSTTCRACRPAEARRQDDRRHLPRQGQDLGRRRDQGAEPRRLAAEHGDHRDPPLDSSGTTSGFTHSSRGRPRIQEQGRPKARTCSGLPALAPRATPA